MIRVHINRTEDNKVTSFTMSGHADYGEHGQDIVCAGASAVAFGGINAIIALTGVEPEIEQSDGGFLKCSFPEQLPEATLTKVQLLLEAMIVSLQTIERDYRKHIQVTFHK